MAASRLLDEVVAGNESRVDGRHLPPARRRVDGFARAALAPARQPVVEIAGKFEQRFDSRGVSREVGEAAKGEREIAAPALQQVEKFLHQRAIVGFHPG